MQKILCLNFIFPIHMYQDYKKVYYGVDCFTLLPWTQSETDFSNSTLLGQLWSECVYPLSWGS